jgi:hypothetical protein
LGPTSSSTTGFDAASSQLRIRRRVAPKLDTWQAQMPSVNVGLAAGRSVMTKRAAFVCEASRPKTPVRPDCVTAALLLVGNVR